MSGERLIDPLTGLSTRNQLLVDLAKAVNPASPGTLFVIFSLNGLKDYKDHYGTDLRNAFLVRLGVRLAATLADEATCYHTREEELAALIHAPITTSMTMLTAAVAALEDEGGLIRLAPTFGAAILPDEASEPIAALILADERLLISNGFSVATHPQISHQRS